MPDVYARIDAAPREAVERIADVLESTARDEQLSAMTATYLADLDLPHGASVLEVGCGTGAVTRRIGQLPDVSEVVGVDPSALLVDRARSLAGDLPGVSFDVAEGRALPFPDATFTAVVFHRVLSHVEDPAALLVEAVRVLASAGRVVVFDGDYATFTLATGPHDPLSACVAAFQDAYLTDPWVVRRLPALLRAAGLRLGPERGYRLVQAQAPDYLLTVLDRGAEALLAADRVGPALAQALKEEGRRRVEAGTFFGAVGYGSVVGTKD